MSKRTPPTYPVAQRMLKDLGRRLRVARISRNLTQEMLAERVGASRATLAKLEAGDATTSMATLTRVLAALGLADQITYLLSNDPQGKSLTEAGLKRPSVTTSKRSSA